MGREMEGAARGRWRGRERTAPLPLSLGAGVAIAAALLATAPCVAAAQEEMTAWVDLVGGAFQHDLKGEGTVPFGGVRASLPLHAWIVVEPGITFAAYDSDEGEEIGLLMPEVQLQARLDLGRVDPFVGLGIGGAFDLSENRGEGDLVVAMYSASAGARGLIGGGWSARVGVRLLRIGDGSATAWTLGVGRSF